MTDLDIKVPKIQIVTLLIIQNFLACNLKPIEEKKEAKQALPSFPSTSAFASSNTGLGASGQPLASRPYFLLKEAMPRSTGKILDIDNRNNPPIQDVFGDWNSKMEFVFELYSEKNKKKTSLTNVLV